MPTIFSLASYTNSDVLLVLCILFLIATAAKSAQLGLHGWLAQAMEGKSYTNWTPFWYVKPRQP